MGLGRCIETYHININVRNVLGKYIHLVIINWDNEDEQLIDKCMYKLKLKQECIYIVVANLP